MHKQAISVDAMRRHIAQLTSGFPPDADVRISRVRQLDQAKVLKDDYGDVLELWLPPVRSAVSYAVALHEIGHIKGRNQKSRNEIVRERAAWQWARDNALVWTPEMERRAAEALAWVEARL
jgi:hypothetical protein